MTTLTLRLVKGEPLTHAEMDDNLSGLASGELIEAGAIVLLKLDPTIQTLLSSLTAAVAALGDLADLNTVGTAQIDNNAVTLAKLVDIATSSFLGRVTGGSGDPEVLTVAQASTLLGLGALALLSTVGTSQIDNDAVTYAKIQNVSATSRVLGRITSGAGDVEELTSVNLSTILGLGALAVLNTVGTSQIDNDAVTYAKIQNVSATSRILGRITAGAGDAEELTAANVFTILGGTTGSNEVVLKTSPTLVTPVLGVATATSINKITLTAPASSAILTIADGKTLTANSSLTLAGTDGKTLTVSNSLTLAGTDATTQTFPAETADIGFRGIPQQSKSANYTTVLGDAGKHVYHPSADNNPRTFTIDSNANVAYAIGTAITFVNEINTVTIAITSDTLTLMGAGTTGSRTLAANGIATALKVSATKWVISGTGLT